MCAEVVEGVQWVEVAVNTTDHDERVLVDRASVPGLAHESVRGGGSQTEADSVVVAQLKVGRLGSNLLDRHVMASLFDDGREVEYTEGRELLPTFFETRHVVNLGIQQRHPHV